MKRACRSNQDARPVRWPRARALCLLLTAACADSPFAPLPPLTTLPAGLELVTFTAQGRPTAPYTLLEIRQAQGFRGFVAVNGQGQPVWYFQTTGSPGGSTQRRNGNFVLLDSQRGLLEVGRSTVLRELAQQPRPGRFIHHDVVATASNTVLFIAEDVRPWRGASITGDAVWEWHPETGAVARRWSTFDHLDPEIDAGPRSIPSDWVHANALSIGPRGNVLFSMHFLDQVVSIKPDFTGLEWRLGGVGATVPVDDPFSGQHTPVEVQTGRVLLFDNGFARVQERYSRAAEYELSGGGARKTWEWRPQRDNWARVISSARRLPNGNTLVAFGTIADATLGSTGPIEVYEVTREGNVVWQLEVSGVISSMYRATPLFNF